MATALYAVGLVLVVEGLVWALAPGLLDQILSAIRQLDIPARRAFGLAALAFGLALLWLAHALGAPF